MKILKPTANPGGRSERRTRSPRACASAGVRADDTSRTHRAMVASYSPVAVDGSSPSSRATWRWNCRNQNRSRVCRSTQASGWSARRGEARRRRRGRCRDDRRDGAGRLGDARRSCVRRSPNRRASRPPTTTSTPSCEWTVARARRRATGRRRREARRGPAHRSDPSPTPRPANARTRTRAREKYRGARPSHEEDDVDLPGQRDEHHSRRFRSSRAPRRAPTSDGPRFLLFRSPPRLLSAPPLATFRRTPPSLVGSRAPDTPSVTP